MRHVYNGRTSCVRLRLLCALGPGYMDHLIILMIILTPVSSSVYSAVHLLKCIHLASSMIYKSLIVILLVLKYIYDIHLNGGEG